MTNHATARKSKDAWEAPDLFGTDQRDMFGDMPGKRRGLKPYVPKLEHVRNSLSSMLEKMRAADTWPWSVSMVRLHREQTFDYLCALIPDEDERQDWRLRIAAEVTRLDDAIKLKQVVI